MEKASIRLKGLRACNLDWWNEIGSEKSTAQVKFGIRLLMSHDRKSGTIFYWVYHRQDHAFGVAKLKNLIDINIYNSVWTSAWLK